MAVLPPLYKAVWFWDDEHYLIYHGLNEGKEKQARAQPTHPRNAFYQDSGAVNTIHFLENVDQNQQKLYKQKYQRQPKPNVPNVITLQDIKDVVTFLMVGSVPDSFLKLIHCYNINYLFRALIVYFQLYLQVWEDLKYRRLAYAEQRLKHPISIERENFCKSYLSKLRSRIGLEYAQLVAGEGVYKRFHHMNNPLNRSYTSKDIRLYEYLIKFSARVVWIALYRSNYKEIETELSRLFHYKNVRDDMVRRSLESNATEEDRVVLQGEKSMFTSHWDTMTPIISDIFINNDKPEQLVSDKENNISGLTAILGLPEELLDKFNLTLGVLGLPRDNFEVMLHVKQGPPKNLEEQELEKAFGLMEEQVEKPMVKMYMLLKDLDSAVDLHKFTSTSLKSSGEFETITTDVRDEINFYLANHLEDSKKSYRLWKTVKVKTTDF